MCAAQEEGRGHDLEAARLKGEHGHAERAALSVGPSCQSWGQHHPYDQKVINSAFPVQVSQTVNTGIEPFRPILHKSPRIKQAGLLGRES